MRLEPATPRDALPIAQASRNYIERGLRWRWRLPAIVRAMQRPNVEVVVARAGEDMAGFGLLEMHERQAHLLLLAVTPAYRRVGVGRRLMAYLEELCVTAGIYDIRLELRAGNRDALRFYQNLDFEVLGRRPGYYQGREDALVMQKRRPQASPGSVDDLSALLRQTT